MSARALASMQAWHLGSLALVTICFAVFRMVSEPYDPSRALVENLVLIGGVLFSAYSLVFIVITGRSTEALPSLLKLYRHALSRSSFLLISNVILTAILGLLVYQLTLFRQVEFLSPTDIEIYLGDTLGSPERLAFVRAKAPTYIRLRMGEHLVAVKDISTQQWIGSQTVTVPTILQDPGLQTTWINPIVKPYENLN